MLNKAKVLLTRTSWLAQNSMFAYTQKNKPLA